MYFAVIKSIDFCLISGIFFNFYCITAHIHGEPYKTYPSPLPPRDGLVQSDLIKVTSPGIRGTNFGPQSPQNSRLQTSLSSTSQFSLGNADKYNSGPGISGYEAHRPANSFKPYGYGSAYWPQYHDSSKSYLTTAIPPGSLPYHAASSSSHSAEYQHGSVFHLDSKYHSEPGYAGSDSLSSYTGPRNSWYPRFPNYPLYPHTAELFSGGYPFSLYRVAKAIAELRSNQKISGTVTFEQSDAKVVAIRGRILGLSPGAHGMHILENPMKENDCSSGGEHFNPQNTDHGGKHDWVRHVGDLGNIFADRDGVAYFDITDQIISLTSGHSVVNRTIVITEYPDDLGRAGDPGSKKNGNSGQPIACGVIELTRY